MGFRGVLGHVAAALVVLCALSRPAWAAPAEALWTVETIGAPCADQGTALEREITLACSAVGGSCRVASPRDAELRAVLDCSGPDDQWSLETRTVEGTTLNKVELVGLPADRLREAAVEVVRDAAPERSLAIETLRFTLPDKDRVAPPGSRETFALAAGGRASSSSEASSPLMGGIHMMGGLRLGKGLHATLGLGFDAGGSARDAVRVFRGSAGLAFGAPFDQKVVGFAIGFGVEATNKYGVPGRDSTVLASKTSAGGFGQGMFIVQWPREGLRPYAALSAALVTGAIVSGAEAGVAIPLF